MGRKKERKFGGEGIEFEWGEGHRRGMAQGVRPDLYKHTGIASWQQLGVPE